MGEPAETRREWRDRHSHTGASPSVLTAHPLAAAPPPAAGVSLRRCWSSSRPDSSKATNAMVSFLAHKTDQHTNKGEFCLLLFRGLVWKSHACLHTYFALSHTHRKTSGTCSTASSAQPQQLQDYFTLFQQP